MLSMVKTEQVTAAAESSLAGPVGEQVSVCQAHVFAQARVNTFEAI